MKNARKIIVLVLIEVFARSIAYVIMFFVHFTTKVAIANLNARKNHALVMLMTENAIKIFVKVYIFKLEILYTKI